MGRGGIIARQAVELHPSMTEGWYELGNVHASEEKFEQALADYNRARQQRPQDPQTAFRMAKVLAKLDRHTEAIQLYREVIKLDPGFWEAHRSEEHTSELQSPCERV